MLVLSRKSNESIQITTPQGQKIEVLVVELRGDKARLGITAPRDVVIDRTEVAEAKIRDALRKAPVHSSSEETVEVIVGPSPSKTPKV